MKIRAYFTITLALLVLSGCFEETKVGHEHPKKLITSLLKEYKPLLRCNPCMSHVPREWGNPSDLVYPMEGQFWVDDAPEKLEPMAFGVLQHSSQTDINITIHHIELDTEFPTVPQELPVYMQSSYALEHKDLLASFHQYHKVLEYHPSYSGIYFAGVHPLTEKMNQINKRNIEQKAKEILGDLIMEDSSTPTTIQHENGYWTVVYYRYVNGYKVYADKPLKVAFDQEGRAISIEGRRRPIIEESYYPTRTPKEALEELQKGNWLHLYVQDFSLPLEKNMERFVIKEMELAYHEQHPGYSRQVLQPYYVFKNIEGQALYIPAIIDAYAER
ncbi:hypothetical protein [Bacillus pinisoli]|uniref:hypothetical protein n=1 Tax=Bacillus pinisoli TaxID=2901866 RepID=UPI001FF633B8|nr:hypothetical protein [Bacillus pinisoli]